MIKNKLILTSDYEIFGNGSGNVRSCLLEPTKKMLSVSEKFGFHICFYVDVCEIWSLQKAEKDNLFLEDLKPASEILQQLEEIINRGHDIQLHLHPQWINSKFNSEKQIWELNYDYWSLPSVESLDFEEYGKGIFGLLNKGKSWLEELIKEWKPDYSCHKFRAGAWCIQPEENVIKALKELGFSSDSSVAPGMKFSGTLTKFDFSILDHFPNSWGIGNRLNDIDSESELMEHAIATARFGFINQLYFTLLKKIRRNKIYPKDCQPLLNNNESINKTEKIKRYILPGFRMLDFSAGTTFEEMKYIAQKNLKTTSDLSTDIIAISHSKNFSSSSEKEFEKFLKWWTEL